jgi:hypothetical protein
MEAARRANRKVFIEKYLLARFFYGREQRAAAHNH